MGSHKIKLLLVTLRHVKFIQIYFQVFYRLKNTFYKFPEKKTCPRRNSLEFSNFCYENKKFLTPNTFNFLNIEHRFEKIDWNFSKHGKLWTYNLNYFDFLQQQSIDKSRGLQLILNFCTQNKLLKDGYEPYPISLRVINWVKFLSINNVKNQQVDLQLYNDLCRLKSHLEYHILANHLFENGFGLLFGAYYFKDEKLYQLAKKIIKTELKEQILADGAHYELAPMYHKILLHRVLDSYQLVSKNGWKQNELAKELKEAAERMLGWLEAMSFNGSLVPQVNDTTSFVSPTSDTLFKYAEVLNLNFKSSSLNESGYRKWNIDSLEILFDIGQIAPSYQPGHSHADNLQIIVHKNKLPILVDTGISTYEKNERRQLERSTSSHNTVTLNNQNSSEVWSGFRVGRRATTKIINDNTFSIKAEHNGYRKQKVNVNRKLEKVKNNIRITDGSSGIKQTNQLEGHLHFHPDRKVVIEKDTILVDEELFIQFNSNCSIKETTYEYCLGFNNRISSTKVIYKFDKTAIFTIYA